MAIRHTFEPRDLFKNWLMTEGMHAAARLHDADEREVFFECLMDVIFPDDEARDGRRSDQRTAPAGG